MPRKRLRPTYQQVNWTFAAQLPGPAPPQLWATARAMQTLWNAIVAIHDGMLDSWSANTAPATKAALYAWFWAVAYTLVRDQGDALGLSAWQKWDIYDRFRAAQRRWTQGKGKRPTIHRRLARIFLPHRTKSGGVDATWIFQGGKRKHTQILPETPGHHWRDAFTHLGETRVPFRVLLHRPLPAGVILKRFALLGRLERAFAPLDQHNPGWRWSFQVTLEMPPQPALPRVKRAMAIDVGWRVLDEGLRVAVVTDGEHCWELRIPWDMSRRCQRAFMMRHPGRHSTNTWEDIIRIQQAKDAALEGVKVAVGNEERQHWPQEAQHMVAHLATMRVGGLMRLAYILRNAGCLPDWYAAWIAQDQLLWRRWRRQQLHLLQARNALYQLFAWWIAHHADVVTWEDDLGLKGMAEADRDATAYQLDAARRYRQMAGLSSLRQYCRTALTKYGRQLVPHATADTSRRCPVAGCGAPIVPGPELERECARGHWEDQDVSAALVMWQDLPDPPAPPEPPVILRPGQEALARGLHRIA